MHYWTALLDLALVCHPLLAYLATRYPKVGVDDSRKRIFYFSFLAILALRYAAATPPNPTTLSTMTTSSTTTTTPNTTTPGAPPAADVCPTHDQPNPIAHMYPNNATGVLNGTVSLLPIPLALARQLIPPQYRILEHAYRALLPAFPTDMYPAVLQAMHDHEVQAFGYKIADFSVSWPSYHQHRPCYYIRLKPNHFFKKSRKEKTNTPAARRPRIPLPRPPRRQHNLLQMGPIAPHERHESHRTNRRKRLRHSRVSGGLRPAL